MIPAAARSPRLVATVLLGWACGCGHSNAGAPGDGAAGNATSGAGGSAGAAGSAGASSGGLGNAGVDARAGANAGGMGGVNGVAGLGGAGNTGGKTPVAGASSGDAGTPAGMSNAGRAGEAAGGAPAGGSASGGMDDGGAPSVCDVTPTVTQSTEIPTVQTVTFTTPLTELQSAEIEFVPAAGGDTLVAPVDLSLPDYKTLLLGMKPSTSYVYRIKLKSSAGRCVSEDYPVVTGALERVPELTVTIDDPAHHERGFLVVTNGLAGAGDGAAIIDADGTVVWVPPDGAITFNTGRAHLSWDATRLFAMDINFPQANTGFIVSVDLDGNYVRFLPDVSAVHHDFAAIPGGIAVLAWAHPGSTAYEDASSVVELLDAGGTRTVVADTTTVLDSAKHTNSIHYYDADRSYTLGDPRANAYVKVTQSGELVWQFGGANPIDPAKLFTGFTPWTVNHGHHLTADGTFAFFNNGGLADTSDVLVYQLDTATLQATPTTSFTVPHSAEFGDVQRLPNGNFLLTASNEGLIQEVTPTGSVVMTIESPGFGYTEFRTSLYGPPQY